MRDHVWWEGNRHGCGQDGAWGWRWLLLALILARRGLALPSARGGRRLRWCGLGLLLVRDYGRWRLLLLLLLLAHVVCRCGMCGELVNAMVRRRLLLKSKHFSERAPDRLVRS